MSVTHSETTFMQCFQFYGVMVSDVGGTASGSSSKTTTHLRDTAGLTADVQVVQRLISVTKMLIGFIFLVLLFSPALSLKCYVCSSTTTNEECNQSTQECQQPLDTCMTTVDTLGSVKAIVKQCASKATCRGAASTAAVDSEGNGNTVGCCSGSNYCNFNAADSIHTRITLLSLTVGLLLLLFH